MSYISPIRLNTHDQIADSVNQIVKRVDEAKMQFVYQYVLDMDIEVDKEELLKALKYDRNMYEKGYREGLADKEAELIVRCKDCKHLQHDETGFAFCYEKTIFPHLDEWCSHGERKEGDDDDK